MSEEKTIERGFGWKPDIPDFRDEKFALYRAATRSALPDKVDHEHRLGPPTDQGPTNSCTGHAWAAFMDSLYPTRPTLMSARQVYYDENVIMGTVGQDNGAYIRDGAKVAAHTGVARESSCKFSARNLWRKPSASAYKDAGTRKVGTYHPLRGLDAMLASLADGYPFVFGFAVYTGFMTAEVARTGVMRMPDLGRERMLGGHAVLAIGFEQANRRVKVRNSWGKGWGESGNFWMPFEFIGDWRYADDAWTGRLLART